MNCKVCKKETVAGVCSNCNRGEKMSYWQWLKLTWSTIREQKRKEAEEKKSRRQ